MSIDLTGIREANASVREADEKSRMADKAREQAREYRDSLLFAAAENPDLTWRDALALLPYATSRTNGYLCRAGEKDFARTAPSWVRELTIYDHKRIKVFIDDPDDITEYDLMAFLDDLEEACPSTMSVYLYLHGVTGTAATLRFSLNGIGLYALTSRGVQVVFDGQWYDCSERVVPMGTRAIARYVKKQWSGLSSITALDDAHAELTKAIEHVTSALGNVPRDQWPQNVRDTLASLTATQDNA